MRTLSRRVRKLEDHYRIGPETEFDRRLRERIAAARQRLAEFAAQNPGEAPVLSDREDLAGLSVEEILRRGRMRNATRMVTEFVRR